MKLRMTEDNVLIEVLPHATTASGLVIPESATSQPPRFVVRGLGPGRMLDNGTIIPPPCAVDDEVLCTGLPAMFTDGDDHRTYGLLKQHEIRAVVIERPKVFAPPPKVDREPQPQNGRMPRNRLS